MKHAALEMYQNESRVFQPNAFDNPVVGSHTLVMLRQRNSAKRSHENRHRQMASAVAYSISGPVIDSIVNPREDATVNLLPAMLYAAMVFAAQPQRTSDDQWLRNLQAEQDRLRTVQEKHSTDIGIANRRLDTLEAQGSPSLGKVSEHLNALQAEVDRHEADDNAAKAAATRNQEEWMRRFDVLVSAILTAALAMGGNIFFGWWKEKRHATQIDAIKGIQASDRVSAEEILKVTKDIATEVRRNNAFDIRQDKAEVRVQGLEDREDSHE